MILGGRFCRRIGFSSSGPAALSLPKEWKACCINESVIHGIGWMGMGGDDVIVGGVVVLPGKCSLVKAMRVSVVLVVSEPSGFLTYPMELELIFF